VLPFRFQVEPGAPDPVVQRRIKDFCAAESFPCLDLLPTIARSGPGAFLDYDHLNPSGAQLVADTLHSSGLLAEGASNPVLLATSLAERKAPGAAAAGAWLQRRQGALEKAGAAAIAEVLDRGAPSERQAAAWALGVARSVAFAATLAKRARGDESAGVRASAAHALGEIGGRAGVSQLFEALGDPSEAVRASAAQALARLGPTPEDVQALARVLESPDRYVAGFAAWSLGNLGAAAEPAVPDLVRALARDETNAVVAGALARVGPAAKAAVPELVKALSSEDDGRRWRAARTLGRIGPEAGPAVEALTGALADPNGVVRAHAARALGRIGPAAMPAAAALQRATGDREEGVRDEARRALDRLRGDPG
jgi:HEAT repeat protein